MQKLKGRVAVVTGASRGIGKAIALTFAEAGAHVAFSYHSNSKGAEEVAREIEKFGVKALAIKADAASEEDSLKMRDVIKKEFGKINILVNNAGTICLELPLLEVPLEEWDRVVNTDLRGVFIACKYLVPLMEKNPIGKVINISSELSFKGRANYSPYVAAKTGLNGLNRCLALELAPDILVNAIAPGPIATDMLLADMEPEWLEKEKDIPLRRLGKPEEIAATALFLASDDANYFCGQLIGPNGGAVLN